MVIKTHNIRLLIMFCALFVMDLQGLESQSSSWAIFSSDIKIIPNQSEFSSEIPVLNAAQGEYIPFQVMIVGENVQAPVIEADEEFFDVEIYEQWFFPIHDISAAPIYASAWIEGDYIADALLEIENSQLQYGQNGIYAIWVDVFVKSNIPPNDYFISVTFNDETRRVPIHVFPVVLEPLASMSIILPIDDGLNRSVYAESLGMDVTDYHQSLNDVLLNHYLVSGHFVAKPTWMGNEWDFSALGSEISRIPLGDKFLAPSPFDETSQTFFFADESGNPYPRSAFEDPFFVEQLSRYFADLHDYLFSIGRLDDALLYPTDESFWVADEPENNGQAGQMRLQQWSQIIFENNLGVMGSRVLPVAWGEDWLEPTELISNSHTPIAYLDAAPDLFAQWASHPERDVSIYLNGYGDLINMSAAMNRGIVWHAYARNVRTIAGYAVLEWYDEQWNIMYPLDNPDDYLDYAGYGAGALVYPNFANSIRLKLLREGVEDSRLLDMYARQGGNAQDLAACLTLLPIALQNPSETVWNQAHELLLQAITNRNQVDLSSICPSSTEYHDTQCLYQVEEDGMGIWEADGAELRLANDENQPALQIDFNASPNSLLMWLGDEDWTTYDSLQLDVYSQSPYFTDLDIALGDSLGNYLLLAGESQIIPPQTSYTLSVQLAIPPFSQEEFDWASVTYLELSSPLYLRRRDRLTNEFLAFPTGERRLELVEIRLLSSQASE